MSGGTHLRRLVAPTSADGLETTEVRWFGDGTLPRTILTWFSQGPTSIDVRGDSYRLDGTPDVGVKRRDHGPLEVKYRRPSTGSVDLGSGTVGRIEEWHKIVHRDGTGTLAGGDGVWLDVDKVVYTRTYGVVDGVARPLALRALARTGCDVELAAVTAGGISAWTFALEAWGLAGVRPEMLRRALAAFLDETPPPAALHTGLRHAMSYPMWLTVTFPSSMRLARELRPDGSQDGVEATAI